MVCVRIRFDFAEPEIGARCNVVPRRFAVFTCPACCVFGVIKDFVAPLPGVKPGPHSLDLFDAGTMDRLWHFVFPIVSVGCACAVALPLIASSFLFKLASGLVEDMVLLPIGHWCVIASLGM